MRVWFWEVRCFSFVIFPFLFSSEFRTMVTIYHLSLLQFIFGNTYLLLMMVLLRYLTANFFSLLFKWCYVDVKGVVQCMVLLHRECVEGVDLAEKLVGRSSNFMKACLLAMTEWNMILVARSGTAMYNHVLKLQGDDMRTRKQCRVWIYDGSSCFHALALT